MRAQHVAHCVASGLIFQPVISIARVFLVRRHDETMNNRHNPGFKANWLKARDEMHKMRTQMHREGEIGSLLGTYVFAPLYWILTLGVVTYWTLRQKRDQRLMDRLSKALVHDASEHVQKMLRSSPSILTHLTDEHHNQAVQQPVVPVTR